MATDVRGHTVPAGSDAFDPQGAIVATSLSINDVVYAANASDRTAKVAAIAPTASDPVLILQVDTGAIWKHDGTTAVQETFPDGDTGWLAATLTGGWADFGSGFRSTAYRRRWGRETLRGTVKTGGTGSTNPILTLPPGHRPAATEAFIVLTNVGAGDLRVDTAGLVYVATYLAGGGNGILSLAGITFDADGS